jgi:membrane-bound serine protease (ClpP class)
MPPSWSFRSESAKELPVNRRRSLVGFTLLLGLLLGLLRAGGVLSAPAPVLVVPLDGAIGPASADFARRAIESAPREGAQLVVLRIDTPGGLDTSMREIIKAILASPVPVAAFVAPSGARAASAGTFIVYAAHIAAMAPGTNLGAASPVAIGAGAAEDKGEKKQDVHLRKATNDAVAYIRGLAELRGRNAAWAERAVRDAVSLPASEAKKMNVVELIAVDVPALVGMLDGRKVRMPAGERRLETAGAQVKEVELDWRSELLETITNPSVAYVLVLVGIYALLFEFMSPGLVLPGVVGAICLLIAAYALHLLPVNYAGLALMLLGIGFMVAEAFVPAYGSLGIGGLVAFVLGSIMLIQDTNLPGFRVSYALIAGVAAGSAAFLILVLGMLARSRKRAVVSGREYMIGSIGEALEDFEREGWARVQGERWKVRAPGPVRRGERLRVASIEGLLLHVIPEGDER